MGRSSDHMERKIDRKTQKREAPASLRASDTISRDVPEGALNLRSSSKAPLFQISSKCSNDVAGRGRFIPECGLVSFLPDLPADQLNHCSDAPLHVFGGSVDDHSDYIRGVPPACPTLLLQ